MSQSLAGRHLWACHLQAPVVSRVQGAARAGGQIERGRQSREAWQDIVLQRHKELRFHRASGGGRALPGKL